MVYAIVGCFFVWVFLQERNKKKVAYTVHVQERTEEAETLDFAVHLFDDETEGKWLEKLNKAFKLAEDRRGFNNQRMQLEYAKMQKEAAEAKAVPFKKA
jgi:hypothetical protein